MYPHQPGGQGQLPPHNQWPPHSSQPPNGAYPPSQPPQALPPLADARLDMAALQHQPPYRLPAPHEMYRGPPPPPHDPYRQPPMPYPPHQPAPRQRTAIACRYCRRRKIRCSGFEASEDGRCTNCARFSQECIFTPVSAQTQAFVPAHTVYRGGANPPPLYGAYGQPLPPVHHQQQQQQQPQPPPPPPQDPYAHARAQPYPYPAPPQGYPPQPAPAAYDDRRDASSRKRPANEPHTPTLPPPNPANTSQLPGQRSEYEYKYPDPTALTPAAVSPASSSTSYHSAQQQPQPVQTPYYTAAAQPPPPQHQPHRRSSPQSTYSYDPSRASSSPHTQAQPGTPGTGTVPYSYGGGGGGGGAGSGGGGGEGLRPPVAGAGSTSLPIRTEGRTPPPPPPQPAVTAGGPATSRPGISISSIVSGDGQGARSAADSDMLSKLR